jgi:predicted DNA-binding protein YlxM (UPF0122 family)
MKEYIKHKREELIWSLIAQDYSMQDIADMFGTHKVAIHRISKLKPDNWESPWKKVR